ncbi:RNA polymerase sigma-70 factor (ECF subfamily) [Haloferula luteola]|uniref:RNA polymerase sigma-70 factor (ECF subfamily) n=1 Tax=Haloferula luteola TaxID=595692 RepID=A0A840VJL6_9BACT|nr:sigma-70 family RNA polymerase sigma factor [Haloferula luteola]MBB5352881.1 RNA polymerase sigma-70 factor (ECF subfamily) [Haloferula luteola]
MACFWEATMPEDSNMIDAERHTVAVQGLFLKFQPMVRSYILSIVPDFSLADDILQETFLVVSRKAGSFELGSSFPAWVKTIARFKALETLRREKNPRLVLSDEVLDVLDAEPHPYGEWREVDRRIELLQSCIQELAPQARRSIEYRYRGDHNPPQIAKLMGCTVGSINVTLSRARTFLRECVERKMEPKSL